MSITAYTGLPGHGKSYGIVENVIVPAVKQFRPVWTNIPCNVDLFLDRFGFAPVVFDTEEAKSDPDWFHNVLPPGALLVLDECWRFWPSGLSSHKMDERHKSYFAEHRHMVGDDGRSSEIVLCTQDLAQVAAFVRNLVETTYRVTKLSKTGLSKSYRVDVYSGPVAGSNPPLSKREREIFGKFDKSVFALYKSHTKSDSGPGDESRADGRYNILKGAGFKAILAALAVLSYLVYLGSDSVSKSFGNDPATTVQPVQSLDPATTIVQAAPVRSRPRSLIDQASSVYIAYQTFSGFWDYVLRFDFDSTYSELTVSELLSLGYSVSPVAQCLLVLTDPAGRAHYVGCQSSEGAGFFDELASGASVTSVTD